MPEPAARRAFDHAALTLRMPPTHYVGLAGVGLLLFATGFSKSGQNLGMALALLAFLAGLWLHRGRWWPVLGSDWTMRWIGVWVVYILVLGVTMAQLEPDTAGRQFEYIWKLSRFFLIGLVAWWIAVAFRHAISGYILLLVGFVLGALIFHHEQGWPWGVGGARAELWEGRQFYTLFSASVLALALILTRDIWGRRRSRWFWARGLLWLAAILLAANSLLVSQSRGGLLGLTVGLVFAGAGLGYRQLCSDAAQSRSRRRQWLAAAIVAVLLAPVLWLGWEANSDRISHDAAVIAEAIESGEIQRSSMGVRMTQWQHAIGLHQERPWFGWGPGAGAYLHELAALPSAFRSAGSHFHSSLIDLLLWTGLIGAAIAALLFTSLAVGLWRLTRQPGPEGRMALAALTVMVIAIIASTTQTYLTSQVSWYYLAAFLGPAHALLLKHASNLTVTSAQPKTGRARQ